VFQLQEFGWSPFFQRFIRQDSTFTPARVIEEQRGSYRVAGEPGEIRAELAGHLRHTAEQRADLPAVGDWVLIDSHGKIHEVLPRRSKFSRKAAGLETAEQIIAANIDTAFLVTSLNGDMNLRRIERYLATIWNSGAAPVLLLSKSDLCDNIDSCISEVAAIACGVPIHTVSAVRGEGMESVERYLKPGETVVLIGSSGVGKSTIINRLLGSELQKTRTIRDDDSRGRHTTTSRRLFLLPGGGMLIDTPGMRELQLWDSDDGISQTFEDIETLAQDCRFRDCRHQSEPGCAVREALVDERLAAERFESYVKLRKELQYLDRKQDVMARIEETRRWKRIHKAAREQYRSKGKF